MIVPRRRGCTHSNIGTTERDSIWQWISTLHEMTQRVSEVVTDFGKTMYPPIDLRRRCEPNDGDTESNAISTTTTTTWVDTPLGGECSRQRDCLFAILNYVMENDSTSRPPGIDGGIQMSEEVMEMGSKLRSAIDVRVGEIESGLDVALFEER